MGTHCVSEDSLINHQLNKKARRGLHVIVYGGGKGKAAGRVANSKILCCSSLFHNKDDIVKSLCSKEVPKLTVRVPSHRSEDRCKENLFPCLGRVNCKCGRFSLPCIYSHITIYVPGWGHLKEACTPLEGASLASSQEIDQMPATLPFSVHTLVFPLKGLVVCLALPSGGC